MSGPRGNRKLRERRSWIHVLPQGLVANSMSKYRLKLYVTGTTPRSQYAVLNLRKLCEDTLKGEFEMEVIDVLERPQLAEHEKILATPTVVKELPHPIRRIIGDLSDREKVLLGLDLQVLSDPGFLDQRLPRGGEDGEKSR